MLLAALLSTCCQLTPKDGDTIVFVGDSITQAGDYVAYVECQLAVLQPELKIRVINSGLSSETASGTSEPDHHPPRPCIHTRFKRDVAAHKPNIVVACYGMNDGNYYPFEEKRFAKYQAGMRRLIDRVFKETPARAMLILTPPPFDATRVKTAPAGAKEYGYKTPFEGYDETLAKYATWLRTLKSRAVAVEDVHMASLSFRARERERDPKYTLAADGVHPGTQGHWLIARAVIGAFTRTVPSMAEPADDPLFQAILKRRRAITQHWLETVRKHPGDDMGVKAVAEGEAKTAKLADEIERLKKAARPS